MDGEEIGEGEGARVPVYLSAVEVCVDIVDEVEEVSIEEAPIEDVPIEDVTMEVPVVVLGNGVELSGYVVLMFVVSVKKINTSCFPVTSPLYTYSHNT